MDKVVYDRIELLEDKVKALESSTNEIYITVRDILNGSRIGEWLANLKAQGISSETYQNDERMDVLVNDTASCLDEEAAIYLLQWAVSKGKANVYYHSALGDGVGVDWASLISPDMIASSSAALAAIDTSNAVSLATLSNKEMFFALGRANQVNFLKNNYLLIVGNKFNNRYRTLLGAGEAKTRECMYLWLYASSGVYDDSCRAKVTLLNGGQQTLSASSDTHGRDCSMFVKQIEVTGTVPMAFWSFGY